MTEDNAAPSVEGEVNDTDEQALDRDGLGHTSDDQTGDSSDPNESGEEAVEEVSEAEKVKRSTQRRINELTRARREAEAENSALREHLADLESRVKYTPATAKPTADQFDDHDDYVEALAEWSADKKLAELQAKSQRHTEAERLRQSAIDGQRRWSAAEEKARESIADYDSVVNASFVASWPDAMRQGVLDSDVGPHLLHHLCANPEEVDRIAQLSPMGQVKALGRLEDKLSSKIANKSNAPKPVSPNRGSGGQFVKDPSKMTDAEWYAHRNRERSAASARARGRS